MITMEILQNREAWLRHRKKGLGGSDIASVIGMNPYMSNQKLFDIKTGRIEQEDISEKPYVKYGTEAEHHLRELYKLQHPQYRVVYINNNSWKNTDYPWANASLDGWLYDQHGRLGIWECKTSTINNASSIAKWKDGIPDNYYCQVLFYMAVLDAQYAIVNAELRNDIDKEDIKVEVRHYRIERTSEVQDEIEYLMSRGTEFWECVKADKRPDLILPRI